MKIGCHVSNSGDLMLAGSLAEALGYGANALMVYLGPPQSTMRKPFNALNSDLLNEGLKQYNLKHTLPKSTKAVKLLGSRDKDFS